LTKTEIYVILPDGSKKSSGGTLKQILIALVIALSISTGAIAQSTPSLTETEKLKIQIVNLQIALKAEQQKSASLTIAYGTCQSTLLQDGSGLETTVSDLELEINKNHPNFSFNILTGKFTPVEKK
jgi:hypothetical protein